MSGQSKDPSELSSRLSSLSQEQRTRLASRLVERGMAVSDLPIPPRQKARSVFPLSFAQERMWFLYQLHPDVDAYHISNGNHLRGEIDPAALERALAEVVRRHETLRTTFKEQGGEPRQVVDLGVEIELPRIDLGALDRDDALQEARFWGLAVSRLRFDLSRDRLLRACLLHLADDEHVLFLIMHHIVSDGWSLGVLWQDLLAFYRAAAADTKPRLSALKVQYGDFAVWQREWLAGEVLAGQIAFWREQLAGAPAVLELPTDRPRPPVQTYVGSGCDLFLQPPLTRALKQLGQKREASLFMTLMAGLQVVLGRWAGQRDFCVGTSIAGRHQVETEGLIGFFVNTLALRVELGGRASFDAHLRRVRHTVLAAHEHQDVPFERLVHELQPERNLAYSPIFQVMFAMQVRTADHYGIVEDAEEPSGKAGERSLSFFRTDASAATFDLNFEMIETGSGGVLAKLFYNTDLFDHATTRRLLRHFEVLLSTAVADPEREIWDLPLLTAPERHAWLNEHNDTARRYGEERFLPQLFAAQASAVPERVALVFGDAALSYAELDNRVERLAAHLRRLGVGPEVRVAVAAERSFELVIALHAVTRAGGAYVPVDPAYPRERLTVLLSDALDASCPVILTQSRLVDRLPPRDATVVHLDEPLPAATESAPIELDGDGMIYTIYTSGSTGQPKGVMNRHLGVLNRILWMQEAYALDAADAVLQKTPFSFDVSVWEFFWPLAFGARLVVAKPGGHQDPAYLVRTLNEERITTLHFVPAMLEVFVEEPGAASCRTVRQIFASGEALPADLARKTTERLAAGLFNLYGPTEAAVDVTAWDCRQLDRGVPIGRPVANTHIVLVDRTLRAVPRGVAGELLIGGVQVARGYLGKAALTAEKFIPDPTAERPGARVYRTGDRVRALAGGELEFLGRIDFQVKVRGFRIELGEIENALVGHAAVREAIVVVRGKSPEERHLVAFVVGEDGATPQVEELREALRRTLPEHMVPSRLAVLDDLPKSPNGKIDRKALGTMALPGVDGAGAEDRVLPRSDVERELAAIWRELLGVDEVGVDDSFFDLGGHSLLLAKVRLALRDRLGDEVSMLDLFRFPTIAFLAAFLRPQAKSAERGVPAVTSVEEAAAPEAADDAVAIIGMAGRFPGAPDLDTLWRKLCEGTELLSHFSDEELLAAGVDRSFLEREDYVKACGLMPDAELFDAAFFAVTPREAEIIDPQQRIFLEGAFLALEQAGYDPWRFAGRVGVFAGVGLNRYWRYLMSRRDLFTALGEMPLVLANDKDYLATRVAYKLDLRGPCVNVQTACSTSLVATHLACQSLLQGECDLALAGGVSILTYDKVGYVYQEGNILSPDGRCRPFDVAAQGTVGSSGAGIVVLKRLSRALDDGDTISAVIKGSAINNDGSGKIGFTAPSIDGQARAIADALSAADVDPRTVSYIEAHGTATPLGDPIEVAALREVYGPSRSGDDRAVKTCALGSLKSNLGHTDAAAGVAGLIKTALALEHGELPPSLHFTAPNPALELEKSPFYVQTERAPWRSDGGPRRAGVSSFGLGGTNAHAVLEEAPPTVPGSEPARPWQLLPISARSEAAVERVAENLGRHLASHPEQALADVAYTLQIGRRGFSERRFVVARDASMVAAALGGELGEEALAGRGTASERAGDVVFLFPGQGSQYPGMGRDLYAGEPVFRQWIDRGAEGLREPLGVDLRELLFPEADRQEEAAEELRDTRFTQAALFVVELALAEQWLAWGIRPAAMVGHSLGELTAACMAGVFTFEEGLALVAARGELLAGLPRGAMTSVPMSGDEVLPFLGEELSLAAVNGPKSSVVSGSTSAVEAFEKQLAERDVATRRLHTSHAFHSPMVEPILDAFAAEVAKLRLAPPRIPFLSNVTGDWITDEEATDPAYWVRHMRQTVRFLANLERLAAERADAVLLEVGPGRTLGSLAKRSSGGRATTVASLPEARAAERSATASLLAALGSLWTAGCEVPWERLHGDERRLRARLPGYPFERQRYWIEPAWTSAPVAVESGEAPRPSGRLPLDDWFHVPYWRPAAPLPSFAAEPEDGTCWLLFVDELGLGRSLAGRLIEHGQTVRLVRPGDSFAVLGDGGFAVDPPSIEDVRSVLAALDAEGLRPRRILHLWGVTGEAWTSSEALQERGLVSLLALTRALVERHVAAPMSLVAVVDGVHSVAGEEVTHPAKATVLGLLKVVSQEYAHLSCRVVDVQTDGAFSESGGTFFSVPETGGTSQHSGGTIPPETGGTSPETGGTFFSVPETGGTSPDSGGTTFLVEQLLAEATTDAWAYAVAYRGRGRWEGAFEPVPMAAPPDGAGVLRQSGVYLLTGGLGRIGLTLADHLARRYRARLVLTSRSTLPPRKAWAGWLSKHGTDDATSRRIKALRALEKAGGEILVLTADAADQAAMEGVIVAARERFGELDGVFHLAGEVGNFQRPLEETDGEHCAAQLATKAKGVEVLAAVVDGIELDFCMLFSSLGAVLGGLGFAAYAAANNFLDAFAQHQNRASGVPWLSVDWDGWSFAGEVDGLALAPAEGCAAVERLLELRAWPQVVVSTGDLSSRIHAWLDTAAPFSAGSEADAETASTASEEGTDDVEATVRGIWREILGIETIQSEDNFFELGGDSLAGIQMITRLRRRFQVQLSLRHLFEAPTLGQLTRALAGSGGGESEHDVLDELLREIEAETPIDELAAASGGRG